MAERGEVMSVDELAADLMRA